MKLNAVEMIMNDKVKWKAASKEVNEIESFVQSDRKIIRSVLRSQAHPMNNDN